MMGGPVCNCRIDHRVSREACMQMELISELPFRRVLCACVYVMSADRYRTRALPISWFLDCRPGDPPEEAPLVSPFLDRGGPRAVAKELVEGSVGQATEAARQTQTRGIFPTRCGGLDIGWPRPVVCAAVML